MGYPAKIQLAGKPNNPQWHINIPNAVAQTLGMRKGESVEWEFKRNPGCSQEGIHAFKKTIEGEVIGNSDLI